MEITLKPYGWEMFEPGFRSVRREKDVMTGAAAKRGVACHDHHDHAGSKKEVVVQPSLGAELSSQPWTEPVT